MLKTVSYIGLTGQLVYAGTWNANTNSPTLTSGVGTKNTYYVVSVAGTTTLDGISSWSVGDWVIFNGTVWEKVLGGTTESFANVAITTATGYLYANNTANVTASLTIPNSGLANSNVIIGNTTIALGSSTANLGNVTLANVTIQSGNATFTNVTAQNHIATANIYANVTTGAFSYGTLGYSDVGIVASYANSSNNYVQIVLQNTNSGTNASSDFVVVNDTGSAYADFGVTSSQYTGTGAFYKPNAPYLYSGSSDLYIGTITANAIHIVANNATTDAITVASTNAVTIPSLSSGNVTITGGTINVTTTNHAATTATTATFANSSLLLVPAGYIDFDLNGTVVKVPYYAV